MTKSPYCSHLLQYNVKYFYNSSSFQSDEVLYVLGFDGNNTEMYSCQEPWANWNSCDRRYASEQMFEVIDVNDTYTECVCQGPLCNINEGIKCYSNPKQIRNSVSWFLDENIEEIVIPNNLITCPPTVTQCVHHGK